MSSFNDRRTEKDVTSVQRIERRLTDKRPRAKRSWWLHVRMAAGVLLLLASCASRPVKACDDRLALRVVPRSLIEASGGGASEIRCTLARVDLAGAGKQEYTAIAYSNGDQGAFVVSKGSGHSATTVFSVSQDGMLGDLTPELELSDLDGDRISEMLVSFVGRPGVRSVWVFQSRGEHVRSITPLDSDEVSLLENAIFVDFDGDHRKDAINRSRRLPQTAATSNEDSGTAIGYSVYKLLDGAFDITPQPLLFAGLLVCGKQEAGNIEETFTTEGGDAPASLRLVNGATGMPVQSATLTVNGVRLELPNDFGAKQSRFETPIHIRHGENTISGKITGPSGSDIAIIVWSRGV